MRFVSSNTPQTLNITEKESAFVITTRSRDYRKPLQLVVFHQTMLADSRGEHYHAMSSGQETEICVREKSSKRLESLNSCW